MVILSKVTFCDSFIQGKLQEKFAKFCKGPSINKVSSFFRIYDPPCLPLLAQVTK